MAKWAGLNQIDPFHLPFDRASWNFQPSNSSGSTLHNPSKKRDRVVELYELYEILCFPYFLDYSFQVNPHKSQCISYVFVIGGSIHQLVVGRDFQPTFLSQPAPFKANWCRVELKWAGITCFAAHTNNYNDNFLNIMQIINKFNITNQIKQLS